MSKSLGNTINPLDIADEFGADALRLALIVGSTPGNDVKVGREKIIASRNFVNKLWNMGRYISSSIEPDAIQWTGIKQIPEKLSPADEWIFNRLETVKNKLSSRLTAYNLSLGAEILRDFTWNEFADWYIEIHKIEKNDAVLVIVFNELLKLWHPFMPFVTEAVHTSLYPNENLPLMVSNWETPETPYVPNETHVENFLSIFSLIQKIRNIRAVYHIDPKEALSLTVVGEESVVAPFSPIIERLGRIAEVLITDASSARPAASASITAGSLHAFVHLGDVIDVAAEKARLEKEVTELTKYITGLKTRLADTRFTEKAPASIIEAQRSTLAESEMKLGVIIQSIQELSQ
jgi:valyl-tRNA synthetase